MSRLLCASFAVKKGVSSAILMCDGRMVNKAVSKISDSSYECLLHSFISTLRLVRNFVDENNDIDRVIFEVNSSTFIKWVNNSFPKEEYYSLFSEAMELLNEIPVQYSFSYNKKPKALMFVDSVDKVKVSGLLD